MAHIQDLEKYKKAQEFIKSTTVSISKCDPWVPIVLMGTELRLEFSYGAIKRVFRLLGQDLTVFAPTAEQLSNPEVMAQLLLCGLYTHQPDLREIDADRILEMMNPRMMAYYGATIQLALEAIQPDLSELDRIFGEDAQEKLPLAETQGKGTLS